MDRCRSAAATAFLPWPMLVTAESALARNDLDGAQDGFAGARTLAGENGDACVEALALRGMALIQERRDDPAGALDLLRRAVVEASRFDGSYAWAHASILTDLVEREDPPDLGDLDDAIRVAVDGPLPDITERLWRLRELAAPQTAPQTTSP